MLGRDYRPRHNQARTGASCRGTNPKTTQALSVARSVEDSRERVREQRRSVREQIQRERDYDHVWRGAAAAGAGIGTLGVC